MNRKPYSTYHGRRGPLRSVLLALVILLALLLCLAVVALFVLPDYIVYTADGPQLTLPFLRPQSAVSTPQPSAAEPDVVIDLPSAAPSPTPTSAPQLTALPRRDPPLGLVTVEWGKTPAGGQGAVYDMTQADLSAITSQEVLALPYAAAWLAPDWSSVDSDAFTARCLTLAGLGFDELLLGEAAAADATDRLAACYTALQAALTQAGYTGRLGLVVDQDIFTPSLPGALADAMAGFDRLYFRSSLRNNVNQTLKAHGYAGALSDIVTVYGAIPTGTGWSWAVLPR